MFNMENAVIEILPGEVDDNTAREVYRNLQMLCGTTARKQAPDREFRVDGSIIDYPQENMQVLLVAGYVRKTERYGPRAKMACVEWTGGRAQDGTMTPKVMIEIV